MNVDIKCFFLVVIDNGEKLTESHLLCYRSMYSKVTVWTC